MKHRIVLFKGHSLLPNPHNLEPVWLSALEQYFPLDCDLHHRDVGPLCNTSERSASIGMWPSQPLQGSLCLIMARSILYTQSLRVVQSLFFHLAEESMKAVIEKQVPDLPIVSRWGDRGSITRHSWLKTFYLWDVSCCLQGDERVPGLKQVEVENNKVRRISLISPLGKANQWSDQPRESVDIGIMNLESRSRDIWEASGVAVTPDPYLNLN